MQLQFEKWHGCRNDFILTWLEKTDDLALNSLRKRAAALCSRRGDGIGADGILVLVKDNPRDELPSRLHIINSDGSSAKTCGNGLRCAAGSILRRLMQAGRPANELPEAIELLLDDGPITCRVLDNPKGKRDSDRWLIAVAMGVPHLNEDNDFHDEAKEAVTELAKKIGRPDLGREWTSCDLSNHHIVLFPERADRELLLNVGPALQQSPHWDGINVHLAVAKELSDNDRAQGRQRLGQNLSEGYEVYVWERGAGETQACGSGACAVAAAVLASGMTDRSEWLAIDMPGGRLFVKQDKEDEPITLAGPAEAVFTGTLVL